LFLFVTSFGWAQTTGAAPAGTSAPLVLTLQDALTRARANSVEFRSAQTDAAVARQDRFQAATAMLPSVTYNNQYLYTEGNGTAAGRFVANNGVHEYISQGNAHEVLGWQAVAEYQRASAAAALARARAEIAARGLVVTVVKDYYSLVAAERKYAAAQSAAQESQRFLTITQQLERGGEVAHADVIKAQLQANDRSRDLADAQLAMERARIDLAALVFRDFNLNFTVVDETGTPAPLPRAEEVEQKAEQNNPELAAALAALRQSKAELHLARAGYLPELALDYWYGIDANQFATRGRPIGVNHEVENLGYSAAATLNIPIWNWGATQSKVKQGALRERQAALELNAAQKKLLGDLQSLYSEAKIARDELETLRQSAELATESLKLTTLRYQAGEASALEVVDAQNTMAQAQNAYADGEVRYQVALANLQTLTGTL
jgi:outer membrane protein TolC